MAKKPEYSSGAGGNYAQFQPVPAGVRRSQADQADWNEISSYRSASEDAIAAGFPASSVYTLPRATFNALGGVKTDVYTQQALDPRIWAVNSGRRFSSFHSHPGTTTAMGISTMGDSWSISSAGTASDGSDSNGSTRQIATSVAAGSDASFTASAMVTASGQLRHNVYIYFKVMFKQISGYRFFAALADGTILGSDSPAVNMIGVRFSPSGGDTAMMLITNDGGATAFTQTLSAAIEVDTAYEGEVWSNGTTVFGRVNNGSIVTNNSDVPTNTTNLSSVRGLQMRSVTAGTEYQFKPYAWYMSQG